MIPALILYGIGANICYTAGWITELLARFAWGTDSNSYGQIAFLAGLSFSVAVTLLPFFIALALAVGMEIWTG
jgi:hypothetical protein